MTALLPDVDPDGLLEYSVVYTDRAVNHMSTQFQSVMRDIHSTLTSVYNAESAIVLPGSGTVGMEAVARQFAHGKRCLVIRNGWFSFRWSQIFDKGGIPASQTVLSAQQLEDATQSPFSPVSALSRTTTDNLHSLGISLFAAAHLALAAGLGALGRGWLWQSGRVLVALSGVFLVYIAVYFATAPAAQLAGPDANDPLFQLASVVGVAMGALLRGLWQHSRVVGAFNAVCFLVWLLLVPVFLKIEPDWLGGYERMVGTVFATWVAGLGLSIALHCRHTEVSSEHAAR